MQYGIKSGPYLVFLHFGDGTGILALIKTLQAKNWHAHDQKIQQSDFTAAGWAKDTWKIQVSAQKIQP